MMFNCLRNNSVAAILSLGIAISLFCMRGDSYEDPSGSRVAEPPITALVFTRDFQHLISGSNGSVVVRTWPELEVVERKQVELESVHDIAVSPDGKHVLLAGGSPGMSGVVQLRSWPELTLEQVWNEHRDVVYQVAWRNDGQEWLSASWDGFAKATRWNAKESHITMTSHSGPVFAATYLADDIAATAGSDRTIAVWKAGSGATVKVLRQHTGTVHALALQPKSAGAQERYLASASEDRTVRFWQPNLGRMVRFLRLNSVPRSIAWSQDGAWLVAACDDGSVIQIDPATLKSTIVWQSGNRVLNVLISANNDGLCLTEAANVKCVAIPK